MARGGGRRTYVRDSNGRFASTPGGGASKRSTPASRRAATRAGNRLNRDNSGRISGIGRNGATARGGRLRTAAGNRRATQTASMKAAGFRPGVIAKGGRGVRGKVARSLAAARKERAGAQAGNATPMGRRVPAAQRPGSLTSTLRGTMRALAQADAARIREVEAITGGKVRPTAAGARAAGEAGARVRGAAKGGKVAATLRAGLRELAQSDARTAREMADLAKPTAKGALKGGSGTTRKRVKGGEGAPKALPAKRGGKVRLPRMATPTGLIRKSDLAKVKADAKTGIGTPMSRAGQRAIARSAREAPLIRKQAIAAAKRKGRTGLGKGPQMNASSIGNSAFNWNRNEQPATARERLAMWQKSERRMIRNAPSNSNRGYFGMLRASRRAAELVSLGNRRGDLPTTRKMAEQPQQRRVDRASRNETMGRLAASDASRRLLPQIQKVRDAAQKRIAEGKKPTAAQREKERRLVGEYNKATRKLQVAQAAKAYTENPYGFKPQRMSGSPAKPKPTPTPRKPIPKGPGPRTRAARPAGTVAKPKGLKVGALAVKGKTTAPRSTATGKRVVTGDRIGRMVGRLAARRDQLIKGGSVFDTKTEQSKDVVRRAMAFVQGKAYDKNNSKQQNLELSRQHMRAMAAGRPQDSPLYKSVAGAIAATPRRSTGSQRKKTKQEILWQADQIIGKTVKKMAATVGKGNGNPIRTQNLRQVLVERFLARKGLLGEYLRLTAAADPIHMKPAGPGIRQPRPRKPRR